jgi:hypothetical protein
MGPDKEKFFMERTLQELLHRLETTILERRIANNVEILTVRAVPDGDEYDKDIALGIRYAVDNGAKVINGSFGKAFLRIRNGYMMPSNMQKEDVLIVHAAEMMEKILIVMKTSLTILMIKKHCRQYVNYWCFEF